jgi:hypothetical protein
MLHSMETPKGTVTFLFSDAEGSTRLWRESLAAMGVALARQGPTRPTTRPTRRATRRRLAVCERWPTGVATAVRSREQWRSLLEATGRWRRFTATVRNRTVARWLV